MIPESNDIYDVTRPMCESMDQSQKKSVLATKDGEGSVISVHLYILYKKFLHVNQNCSFPTTNPVVWPCKLVRFDRLDQD